MDGHEDAVDEAAAKCDSLVLKTKSSVTVINETVAPAMKKGLPFWLLVSAPETPRLLSLITIRST